MPIRGASEAQVPSIGAAAACAAALISAWGRATPLAAPRCSRSPNQADWDSRPSAAYTGTLKGLWTAVQGQRLLAAAPLDCSTVNCSTTTEDTADSSSFLAKTNSKTSSSITAQRLRGPLDRFETWDSYHTPGDFASWPNHFVGVLFS